MKEAASQRSLGGARDYPTTYNQLPTIFSRVAVDPAADPRQAWTTLQAIEIGQCAGFGTAA
ncbi:MAG TPA: hypothetical protein VGO01_20480 [Bradyrhizobium sp.]|nr:hypothetical protein [Bradyrhizobium sp.]